MELDYSKIGDEDLCNFIIDKAPINFETLDALITTLEEDDFLCVYDFLHSVFFENDSEFDFPSQKNCHDMISSIQASSDDDPDLAKQIYLDIVDILQNGCDNDSDDSDDSVSEAKYAVKLKTKNKMRKFFVNTIAMLKRGKKERARARLRDPNYKKNMRMTAKYRKRYAKNYHAAIKKGIHVAQKHRQG